MESIRQISNNNISLKQEDTKTWWWAHNWLQPGQISGATYHVDVDNDQTLINDHNYQTQHHLFRSIHTDKYAIVTTVDIHLQYTMSP